MVEMNRKDNIKKKHDHYVHKIEVIYPLENVKNMKKSWEKTAKECKDWLDRFDEHLKEADRIAKESVDASIKQEKEEVEKLLGMSDKERLKYWNNQLNNRAKEINKVEKEKEERYKEQYEKNKELLYKYKKQYEAELKEKKEALKKWSV